MDDHAPRHSPHQDEPSISELSQHSEHLPSYHHTHLASEEAMPLIMAPRMNPQNLAYFLSATSLWNLLFILAIFNYTTILALCTYTTTVIYLCDNDWLIDGIFCRCEESWYAMYRFAWEMLSFQTFAFAVVYLARFVHGIRNAVPDDDYDDDRDFGSRTRQRERSYSCRRLWMGALATNFVLVWSLAEAVKWQHQRETMDRGWGSVTEVVVVTVTVDVTVFTRAPIRYPSLTSARPPLFPSSTLNYDGPSSVDQSTRSLEGYLDAALPDPGNCT